MREKSFCDTVVSPSFFQWEDCTPTQQILSVLWHWCSKGLHFWRVSCVRAFMFLALENSLRLVAKWRSGRTPPWCCFSVCFPVVLHSLTEHIPFSLPRNHLCFIICRWKKKKKHTDKQEEFFYLISLWLPARFWNVCALCSNRISLIIDCKNLSASSLLFFFFPFSISFFPFLFPSFPVLSVLRPVCSPDYPLTFFSSWWNLFVLLTLRVVPNLLMHLSLLT